MPCASSASFGLCGVGGVLTRLRRVRSKAASASGFSSSVGVSVMSHEPEIIFDFDPRNLPPELLQAIGLVVSASSQTETVVQDFIGGVLGIDNINTRALTAHMSAPLKDHVARALMELHAVHVADLDAVDDLLDAINDAFSRRNQIVHNAFLRNSATGEILSYRESARGSLVGRLEPVLVEKIVEDAALIYEAGMDLMRFMIARNLLPPMRRRPLMATINRKPKARANRRDTSGIET